jgi:hypothetical protein
MTQPLGNCPCCAGDEPFEQVHRGLGADDQCPDVDGECPEWMCTACGAAVIMGTIPGSPASTGRAKVSSGQSIRAA